MKEGFPRTPSHEKENAVFFQEIGDRLLNEEGQFELGEIIRENDIQRAKEYLFGAVDALFEYGSLSFEEAAKLYKQIGVSPERASELRQQRGGMM